MNWHPDMPEEYRNQIVTGDARLLAERLPDESVDLVLTDPPFGIGFEYSNGYDDRPEEYEALVRWIVRESNRVLRPGGLAFVYQSGTRVRETWQWFPPDSRLFAACKNFVQIRPAAVQWAFDPVVFWRKPGPLERYPARDWHVSNTANIGGTSGVPRARFHCCPRPVDSLLYLAGCCAPRGVILDWFVGSGTTAIAAKMTGRLWIGFEQDPETATLARERVRLTPEPLLVVDAPEPQMALGME